MDDMDNDIMSNQRSDMDVQMGGTQSFKNRDSDLLDVQNLNPPSESLGDSMQYS